MKTAAGDSQGMRQALGKALASPEFQLSTRMRQLLQFLVEATLANRGAELKETVVGTEVFGRAPDYDPKIDPVVRKEARRLRLKLQEYYQGSGAGESSRIDLPKGGYVPVLAAHDLIPVERPAASHRARLRWALPIVAALVLMTASLVALLRVDMGKAVLVPAPLTSNSGVERSPAFSPDGKEIAYAWQSETDPALSIYVQALHGDSLRRLTSSGVYENHPAWSPDGRQIAFVRSAGSGRYTVCLLGLRDGAERLLTEIWAPDHVDWSPDGAVIAASDAVTGSPASIVFVSVKTGGRRQTTFPSTGAGDTFPRFSPDGSRLAFLRSVEADIAEVYLLDLKSSRPPRQLTAEHRKIEGFTWMPDGRSLVVSLARGASALSLWRLPVNGGAMERVAAAGTLV